MNLRHLQDTDIESLLRLWNRSARFDNLTPELLEEKVFDDPDYQRELTLVVDDGKQLVGFMMGVVRQDQAEKPGFVKLLAIDPALQRRGLCSRLLQELEDRLQRLGCAVVRLFDSNPNYLVPGLDPRYTEAVAFFEKRGYERFGETSNMEADLFSQEFDTVAEESKLRTDGIELRRAIMGDHEVVMQLLQHLWPAWIPEVQRAFLNYPVSLHLASFQDRVIAFAAYDTNNFNTGWFGPMGTDPAARGKGVGGVLLKRCLMDIKAQGHRSAVIPWVGPHAFYNHRCGARISRIFWRYKKELNKVQATD